MTSSVTILSEDQLQCPICLDVFIDPVTTSCGHNFCMICLKNSWKSSFHIHCPLCKKKFPQSSQLSVNTFISSLAAPFIKSVQVKSSSAEENPIQSLVLCDICCERKCEAVKSCLICMTSYCKTHLKRHEKVSSLKKHKLINPVKNPEDYSCQKHDSLLELFCKDDQMCVCQFCIEDDHKTHNTVPIEMEITEKKVALEKTQAEIQQLIQERLQKIEEVKHSGELNKKYTEREKAEIEEILGDLMQYTERKQKSADRQVKELIKELEQEITELKKRNNKLEHLSHTEDYLHLLQIYPSLCSPPNTQDWTDINIPSQLSVATLRTAQFQEILTEETKKLNEHELRRIQQHAVDVTLDPDTANPKLLLSDDGKQVRFGIIKQNLPDSPKRFDRCPCILGKEGFSSGRFYYEVQVSRKTKWDLGVTTESSNRKGKIIVSPIKGYWCLFLRNQTEYKAQEYPPIPLSLKQVPQKVGVFVDYEEGLVSFYDVDAKSHIYSFTGQTFTEKLYPLFSTCIDNDGSNSGPLTICPVSVIKNNNN